MTPRRAAFPRCARAWKSWRPSAVLDQMKVGAKVRFLLSGGHTIVAVRPAS